MSGGTLVILDTSFILNALKYRALDLLEIRSLVGRADIVLPSSVKYELEKLGRADILGFLAKGGARLLPGEGRFADREIVSLVASSEGKTVVATQDAGLRRKLKSFKAKCGLIVVRGKKKLELSGFAGGKN